jgi:hypothetical protein
MSTSLDSKGLCPKEVRLKDLGSQERIEVLNAEANKLTIEEIKQRFIIYAKLYQRIQKNGDNIRKKIGRKTISEEAKEETYQKTLQRKKDERKAKSISEGKHFGQGRGRKKKVVV